MQISNRAWHIRFIRFFADDYQPKNLCRHFWRVVLVMAACAILPSILLALVGLLAFVNYLGFQDQPWVLGGAYLVIGGLFGGAWAITKCAERRKGRPKTKKPPGLLRSWLKARKERYCPLIEVVED